jgi:hypothetical protein
MIACLRIDLMKNAAIAMLGLASPEKTSEVYNSIYVALK